MKRRCLLMLVCGLAGHAVWAAEPAERDELRRQRQAIEADYTRREEACRQQFVVTPCLDKLRVSKQQALEGVRAQEDAFDAAERLKRAEAQKRRLAEKAQAAEGRAPAKAASAPAAREARPPAPRAVLPRSAKAPAAPASSADRRAQAQQKRADFEARQREIQAHRAEVEKRNAERAKRKGATPLPVPASSASADVR